MFNLFRKKIKVKYFDTKEYKPKRLEKIEKGDWIDLYASKDIFLVKGNYAMIPLGVAMELPRGYEANVVPRSSSFKTWGILQTNSYGVIDESYKGDNDQWHMPVYATRNVTINKGDKICQFRINKKMKTPEIVRVEVLGNENRNGFGSTGSR